MNDAKHGTPECWSTCACKECDEAQRKASNDARKTADANHHARKMTDADHVNAFLAAVPGEGAAWWRALVEHGRQVLDKTQNRPPGDGTVNKATWGHLRNIVEAARQFAFVLGAAERGDDPDIPF